jgi:hypothetical protein
MMNNRLKRIARKKQGPVKPPCGSVLVETQENRKRMTDKQEALVQCLIEHRNLPSGFDRARVAVCARTLQTKRLNTILRLHPWVETVVGDELAEMFERYARRVPSIPKQGASADAQQFFDYLCDGGKVSRSGSRLALTNLTDTSIGTVISTAISTAISNSISSPIRTSINTIMNFFRLWKTQFKLR